VERWGQTLLFNGGHQRGPIPSHVSFDLGQRTAAWWSFESSGEVSFDAALPGAGSVVG
jgi:hypothetical protein